MPRPSRSSKEAETTVNPPLPTEKIESLGLGEPEGPPQDLVQPRAKELRRTPKSDWDWQAHLGYLTGQVLERDQVDQSMYLGGLALWKNHAESSWEFSVDVTANNLVRIGTARRTNLQTALLHAPYWKTGLTQTVASNRFVSGFVDLERVKAIGAVGLEELFESYPGYSFEFGMGWGLNGLATHMHMGYRRAF
jgi:hypothetical protein